jgi:hypothetical protein
MLKTIIIRGDHFWLGSFFIYKKSNQTIFFFKSKPVQTDLFRFGSVFLGQKPVQTGLARFFSGLVRFFRFQASKTKTEPNRSVFSKFYSV